MILESIYTSSDISFLTASDSPVSDDSSQLRFLASIKTKSAGDLQPSSRTTISPTVNVFASTSFIALSLLTIAFLTIKSLRLSTARCDLYSWIKPRMVLSRTASMMTPASMTSPIKSDAIAAIIRRAIRMSMNWDKNKIIGCVGFSCSISFKP